MNFFESESDTYPNISGSMLSIIVAGKRGTDIAQTPVDMSASLYS